MELVLGSNKTMNWVCLHLLLALVFSANAVLCCTLVKSIPGFDGYLPFKLYTGYVSVGKSEMFYYFIESEGNPREDPLLLWYTGGPGCSVFNALIYENDTPSSIQVMDTGIPLDVCNCKGSRAGHSALEYNRRECYIMFDRFIPYYPL